MKDLLDTEKLLKSKHIKVCGNRFFNYSCIVKDGISKLYSVTICGMKFLIPQKSRKQNNEERK